jgi:3-hexulose-6-phosphate synthase/6-phospho-3-hexuloisomerase
MADLMLHADKPGMARRLQDWGVDVILVHTGYDERHHDPRCSPLRDLEAVRAAVRVPLQAVGGLSIEQAARMPALGAPLVVIGAPLAVADQEFRPAADPAGLHRVLSEFVGAVKGACR